MKALFVSGDRTITDRTSKSAHRMRAYAALCDELHVVVAGASESYTEGNLFVYGFRGRGIGKLFTLPKRIQQIVLEKKVAVVSAQDPFEYGFTAYLGMRGTGAKLHIQIHTDFLSLEFIRSSPFLNTLRMRIADRILPKADGIRVVSNRIRASVHARYGSRVPEPVCIPVQVTSPQAGASWKAPFPFTLVTIARLEKEKDLHTLLRALQEVREKYPQAGVALVGSGRMRTELEIAARTLGVADGAIFLGERNDTNAILEGATAYVQTSAYEGYGMALVEAARAGLPIISTDVGIIGDVLVPERDLLVVPHRDAGALAKAIVRLIEDTQLRDTLRLSAQGAALAHLQDSEQLPARVMGDLSMVAASATSRPST